MTEEKRRLYGIVGWSTLVIPIWVFCLWASKGERYIISYLFISIISEFLAIFLLLIRKNYLFWYFIIGFLAYFPSMVLGISLNIITLLIIAFGRMVSPNLIIICTLLFIGFYCIIPLNYYLNDYRLTKKQRLKSFDFDKGSYDITHPSIVRSDAFADFYFKSFLFKAHHGLVKFHLIFPISGGAIAIIAGNISKNFQLGIGLVAMLLTVVLSIQGTIVGPLNAWIVYRLEKRYGKKIIIDWKESE